MTRRKARPADPRLSLALPADVRNVTPETSVDPLTENSADVWARWSRDKELRDVVERRKVELHNKTLATQPLYPRECAAQVAESIRLVAPDWRHARATLGPAWGRLLKAQPELAPELTKRREAIVVSLFNATPPEYHRAISDLRALFDLVLIAHEAAAYVVGFESGQRVAVHDRPTIEKGGA
jgi:hypothetical protein